MYPKELITSGIECMYIALYIKSMQGRDHMVAGFITIYAISA